MTEKKYICNICRTVIDQSDPECYQKIFGIYFARENEWVAKFPYETDTHICKKCLIEASKLYELRKSGGMK